MDSRAGFPTVTTENLRGNVANNIDTGYIPTPTGGVGHGPENRGVEMNTARGVKEAPVIIGITKIEYGSAADQPIVDNFETYGGN
jgi:hypothetical protein